MTWRHVSDETHPGRRAAAVLAVAGVPAAVWAPQPIFGLPSLIAVTVVAVALFGSDRLSERAFRLLRWAADRPEPLRRTSPAG
ncbi:hypothetical protein [Streptosporangium sp. NPDC049376]|uniref:hypothetical protein n=1 Tax=Streptosporangium sp. NPDC049376 TaxID=3366192 RepID=UPI0037AF2B99